MNSRALILRTIVWTLAGVARAENPSRTRSP